MSEWTCCGQRAGRDGPKQWLREDPREDHWVPACMVGGQEAVHQLAGRESAAGVGTQYTRSLVNWGSLLYQSPACYTAKGQRKITESSSAWRPKPPSVGSQAGMPIVCGTPTGAGRITRFLREKRSRIHPVQESTSALHS